MLCTYTLASMSRCTAVRMGSACLFQSQILNPVKFHVGSMLMVFEVCMILSERYFFPANSAVADFRLLLQLLLVAVAKALRAFRSN